MEEALRELQQAIKKVEEIIGEIIEKEEGDQKEGHIEGFDPKALIKIISAVSNLERMTILKEISAGGKYFTELLEATGLTNSSLYFHLKVLQEAGMVKQEYQRGKYLLTELGKAVFDSLSYMHEKCRRWLK